MLWATRQVQGKDMLGMGREISKPPEIFPDTFWIVKTHFAFNKSKSFYTVYSIGEYSFNLREGYLAIYFTFHLIC